MKMEKIVGAIAWIPLQLPAALAVNRLNFWVAILPCWPDYDNGYYYGADSFVGLLETMASVLLFAVVAVAIVGEVILIRHDFGSERFNSLFKKWYLAFAVLYTTTVIFLCVTCRIVWSLRVLVQLIIQWLYPIIALAELMIVVVVARWVNRFFVKKCNRG